MVAHVKEINSDRANKTLPPISSSSMNWKADSAVWHQPSTAVILKVTVQVFSQNVIRIWWSFNQNTKIVTLIHTDKLILGRVILGSSWVAYLFPEWSKVHAQIFSTLLNHDRLTVTLNIWQSLGPLTWYQVPYLCPWRVYFNHYPPQPSYHKAFYLNTFVMILN